MGLASRQHWQQQQQHDRGVDLELNAVAAGGLGGVLVVGTWCENADPAAAAAAAVGCWLLLPAVLLCVGCLCVHHLVGGPGRSCHHLKGDMV